MKSSFKTGAIALAFLVLGFELAMFVRKTAEDRIVANRDRPDTVFLEAPPLKYPAAPGLPTSPHSGSVPSSAGRSEEHLERLSRLAMGTHSPEARAIYERAPGRRVESFRFNPNTVSLEELCRLGFSEKQAQSILNYREKGGRFRRKADFAKSYVVADSVFERLEPFIMIPKTDINKADSADFDELPGIGGWFAHRMVEYREQLRGYSCPEQLMEIYRFDQEKFDGLKDLISCSPADPYPFWTGSLDDIRNHPHIRNWQTARDIAFYRDHNSTENLTVDGLLKAGILSEEQARRLARCRLK
jgi:DNA uptake protein ComE-like DNA-binding protein